LFNIIQNSVKYNKCEGLITIKLSLVQKDDSQYFMSTLITDEGSGIDKSRIPSLFQVFGELKQR
jgi:signal transduction histidine kinase